MKRLIAIQNELKAPKNQRNNFGGYNYRSCEDILEAVKPLCKKHGLLLIVSDDIVSVNNGYHSETLQTDSRIYVKATASLYDAETRDRIAGTTAFAREEEIKKGMDASQITGSASSYARKYALNGLFAIDDTKDADATNNHGKTETIKEVKKEEKTEYICKKCGKQMTSGAYLAWNGLCSDCKKKEDK